MSLLRKASIVTTPTAYENGKILSVKPAKTFGNELVTNGSFSDGLNNWTDVSNWWSVVNGEAYHPASTSIKQLYQDVSTEVNKKYKISVNVNIISGTPQVFWDKVSGQEGQSLSQGLNEIIVTTFKTNSRIYFGRVNPTNAEFYIDNVSVKEAIDGDFDFTRNSSATRVNSQGLIEDMQILSGDLVSNGDFSQEGSELITNGDFSNGSTDWFNPDNAATFSNNSVTITGGSGNRRINQSNVTSPTSSQWKLQYEITEKVGTSDLKVYTTNSGSATYVVVPSTIGVHTYFFNTNLTTFYFNFSNSAGSITIDNVSVKEVGQDWSLGTGWSIGEDKVTSDGSVAGNDYTVGTESTLIIGKTYKVEYTVLDYIQGNTRVRAGGGSSNFVTANGIYIDYMVAVSTENVRVQAQNNFIGSITNISIIEITEDTNLPRIDYTGGEGHWLFEPQSTNLYTYSNDVSFWTKSNAVATSDYAVSPDGTQNAFRAVFSSSAGLLYVTSTGAISTNNTLSVWAKSNGGSSNKFRFFGNGNTLKSNDYVATNEWQRFEFTYNCTSVTSGLTGASDSATNDVLFYGFQHEALSYATSYIPTEGSIKTRLQDAAFGAGSSDLINSTEGVLYAEIASLADFSGSISINDATVSNRIELGFTSSSRAIIYMEVGGVLQVYERPAVSDITSFYKIAFKWKLNDFSLYINGNKVAASSSGVTPSANTFNNLSFNGFYSNNFFGKTKCLAVFKEALNNDELECLTGEGYDSFNALALANNYTII